jgi:hypothetical protein
MATADQLHLFTPSDGEPATSASVAPYAPPPPAWLGFTPEHDPAAALATYCARYGVEAAQVVHCPGLLLVGPLEPGQTAGSVGHVQAGS